VRLTRRDRAAMELTLCHLRALAVRAGLDARAHTDFEPLRHGGEVARHIRRAVDRALSRPEDWGGEQRRKVRCALALLLRALLRADADDFGPAKWVGCTCSCDGDRGGMQATRYTPLWEIAPVYFRRRRTAPWPT